MDKMYEMLIRLMQQCKLFNILIDIKYNIMSCIVVYSISLQLQQLFPWHNRNRNNISNITLLITNFPRDLFKKHVIH